MLEKEIMSDESGKVRDLNSCHGAMSPMPENG